MQRHTAIVVRRVEPLDLDFAVFVPDVEVATQCAEGGIHGELCLICWKYRSAHLRTFHSCRGHDIDNAFAPSGPISQPCRDSSDKDVHAARPAAITTAPRSPIGLQSKSIEVRCDHVPATTHAVAIIA